MVLRASLNRHLRVLIPFAALGLQAACFELQALGQITLTNASSAAGLSTAHMPDTQCIGFGQYWMTGGIGIGDFNNDGWPDIFMIGGGLTADKLFMNNGDGTFTNLAAEWGVAVLHGGNGVAVGDYNNDGWLDIYVTSFGQAGIPGQPGKHRLYKNNGNGTFTNVAAQAGVNYTTTTVANGYGACWGDYDLDGKLDLFVTSWKDTSGGSNNGTGNRLFHNNGDGTFTDITSLALGNAFAGVWGFQGCLTDMNGDLFPELLVSADFKTSRYLVNNGNGTFASFTTASGTGKETNGMGQAVGDFNNDGLLDWYVTSIYLDDPPPNTNVGNMLYINQGANVYAEHSQLAGVNDGGWGWGTIAVDLDQDGYQDIIEVNGRNAGEWANEQEYLWHNNGDLTFTEISRAAGLDLGGDARAVAYLDADRDGDLDFLITVNSSTLRYYRNDTSNQGNWLQVTLDTSTNPLLASNGYGSRIIATAGGLTYVRYINGSPSYLATSQLMAHFGLGSAKLIDQLKIYWNRGNVTTLSNVTVNQFLIVHAPIPADITADGIVNVDDLLALINAWGACQTPCPADVDGNGTVNVDDLLALINNWG